MSAALASGLTGWSATASADAAFGKLQALTARGAEVSALAVDLSTGRTIATLNASTRLSPASISKLVVTAAALHTWDPTEQFDTMVLAGGPVKDGVLNGELILRGGGDPSLDGSSYWALAAQIKREGIQSVTGGVRVLPAPFGVMGCETKDRCDALAYSDRSYVAMLSSVGIDFGNWCVEVRPTRVGAQAEVAACHAARLPVPVEGTVTTVAAGSKQTFWVQRVTTASGDVLRVSGDIPAGGGQRMYRSMSDPALGAGQMFAEIVREAGITVAGTVRVESGPLPPGAKEIGTVQGLTVREQLGRMLHHSNNFIADVLTLDLAARTQAQPPASLAEAGAGLARFVAETNGGKGAATGTLIMNSGSGLTPDSRISANDMVGMLRDTYLNTRIFPSFYSGLIVPRDAPYAFLRRGNANWLDRVALKTGTMSEPRSVSALSGYLRKKDGGWIAFTTIVNGGQKWKQIPLSTAIEAARGDIEGILAAY